MPLARISLNTFHKKNGYMMFNFLFISQFILFGFYPETLIWRPILVLALIIAHSLLVVHQIRHRAPLKNALLVGFIATLTTVWLIFGDGFLLTHVEQNMLTGLMLNMCLAYWTIPLATLLAVIATYLIRYDVNRILSLSLLFISKLMRSIPLISILFFMTLIFPMFFGEDIFITRLEAAILSITLFVYAYLLQVFLGSAKAISNHQHETAFALNIRDLQKFRHIDMPQILKYSIPALVNTYVGVIKDTTLVMIIGLSDSLGNVQLLISKNEYKHDYVLFFFIIACLFWVTCSGTTGWGKKLERETDYVRE